MKITRVETFAVPPRWLFCRIETDEGSSAGASPWSRAGPTPSHRRPGDGRTFLVGKDPLRIEDHWQVMTKGGFYRGGAVLTSAVAGIDQALWDITGKALGGRSTSCSAARCATGCASTAGSAATSPREVGDAGRAPRWRPASRRSR